MVRRMIVVTDPLDIHDPLFDDRHEVFVKDNILHGFCYKFTNVHGVERKTVKPNKGRKLRPIYLVRFSLIDGQTISTIKEEDYISWEDLIKLRNNN